MSLCDCLWNHCFQTSRATKSEIQCIHLCANQDLSIVSVHFLEKQSAKAKEMLLRHVFLGFSAIFINTVKVFKISQSITKIYSNEDKIWVKLYM